MEERVLSSIPASIGRAVESPSIIVESARGKFLSDTGDVLEVRISTEAVLHEDRCQADPEQQVQLMANVSIRIDDGVWNETVPLGLYMSVAEGGQVDLEGSAEVALRDIQGTFVLPNTVKDAGDKLEMAFRFRERGWTLERSMRSAKAGATGAYEVVWSARTLLFTRARNI